MTPFKDNITKSIDNLNKLQEDVENTITDLQEQVVDLEEQIEEMENLETKEVTITTNTETTIEPTTGKYALEKVVVITNVQPNLEEKTLTITENKETTITPSENYQGLSRVVVTTNVASGSINNCTSLFSNNVRLNEINNIIPILRPTNCSLMFQGCTNITTIDLNTLDMSNATILTQMFNGCTSMTSIDIDNWNTESVTEVNNMFVNCTSLVSIDFSNVDLSSVTDWHYGNMFSGCSQLSNDSLQSILQALLTITVTNPNTNKLSYVGLSSTQADICVTFDEWTTLVAKGWTTGY